MSKPRKKIKYVKKFKNKWAEFTGTLPHMTEEELKKALTEELKSKEPRKEYLLRIHRKYNQVRYAREQREYGIVT